MLDCLYILLLCISDKLGNFVAVFVQLSCHLDSQTTYCLQDTSYLFITGPDVVKVTNFMLQCLML